MSAEGRTGLSTRDVERFQAHLTLPGFGVEGQRRLRSARVLLVGVGGLGCPAALYLAAAGVGTLGLVDDDVVDGTNLQRQVLYGDGDRGRAKVEAAAERLRAVDAGLDVVALQRRLTAANALETVAGWDLVVDGSDNFPTRYVVNDACVLSGVPLVSGSLYQFEGQVTVIRPPATPCYRCLFPAPPREQPACRDVGVLGPLAGIVGTIQAAEAVKLLVGGETSLMGRLLLVDSQQMSFRQVKLRRDPACPLCGRAPSIRRPTAVTDHAACDA